MQFIDSAQVFIKSGDGGHGCLSFHREKFVPKGGPDGGDGGDGGDVIFIGDSNLNTLSQFRHVRKIIAQNGETGKGKQCFGKKGKSKKVRVPCGTIIKNMETDEIVAEILELDQPVIIAKGGQGGRGNVHFATSTDQAPRTIEKGKPGVSFKAFLELKLIADVGLVGFPNAGKSTLISSVSNAKPKIANYPFTTLTPQLGVIDLPGFKSIVMADIPGIIEGAAKGKGLGIQFLKHIERTKILLFVIDCSDYADIPPADAFTKLKKEIQSFGHGLHEKQYLIALNKSDLDTDQIKLKEILNSMTETEQSKTVIISAATKQGLKELIQKIQSII